MVRRVVTGHDEQGRSCVVSDAEAHAIPFGHAGGVFHLVWGRDDVAHFPDRGVQPRWRGPSPPPGGCRVTFMELPPGDENDLDDYVMDELPAADGVRPGMHATPTLDFDIVLTGRVGLELEEGEVTLGPGDVVVLNGALHRWRNRGSTAATVAVFVVGATHDAFRSTSTQLRLGAEGSGIMCGMGTSAESVVRRFLASWRDPNADELASYLAEDAVWVDGPNGVHSGASAIVQELMRQLTIPRDVWMEIDTLLASDDTVMVEWHGGMTIGSAPVNAKVMAVFEVDVRGRIKQMRESFDMKSLVDQFDPQRPK